MKIIAFEAQNIKRLKVVQIFPKGNMVQLTGANGEGKTSVLDAILYALAGTEGLPSQPIRRGAEKGGILIDLGDLVVKRIFTPTGSNLIVQGKKGERYQKPQQMLDRLFGDLTFDPLAFTRMKPKDQADELRRLVRLEIDPEALDKANQTDYDARREVNRQIKTLETSIGSMTVVSELPAEPIDLSALLVALESAGTHNASIVQIKADLAQHKQKMEDLRKDAARDVQRAEALTREADALRASAKTFLATVDRVEAEVKKTVIPTPVDTADLREEIENARATNTQIAKRTERERLEAQLVEVEARVKELNEAMESRSKMKTDAIAAAQMPVPGLGFQAGEVYYNELPLNQASGAEQLRVSCAIAMAANPEIRIIRITDGSLLDDKSLELIKQMAVDRDYQIWIERVDTTGKIGIVMEDGEVKTVNEEPEPQPPLEPAKVVEVLKDVLESTKGMSTEELATLTLKTVDEFKGGKIPSGFDAPEKKAARKATKR